VLRTIFNGVACGVTLVAVAATSGESMVRTDTLPCDYVCTSACPTPTEQKALCKALGGPECQWIPFCPEESTHCSSPNYETPCLVIEV
jgi:hypothetical protein